MQFSRCLCEEVKGLHDFWCEEVFLEVAFFLFLERLCVCFFHSLSHALRLHDFFLLRLHDFFVERLCDFFVERLHNFFVERLRDFFC